MWRDSGYFQLLFRTQNPAWISSGCGWGTGSLSIILRQVGVGGWPQLLQGSPVIVPYPCNIAVVIVWILWQTKTDLSVILRRMLAAVLLHHPANTRRSPNVGSIMGQRRRRWANIEPTLGERLVFAWMHSSSWIIWVPQNLFSTPFVKCNVYIKTIKTIVIFHSHKGGNRCGNSAFPRKKIQTVLARIETGHPLHSVSTLTRPDAPWFLHLGLHYFSNQFSSVESRSLT